MAYPPGFLEESLEILQDLERQAWTICCDEQHKVNATLAEHRKARADLGHYKQRRWSHDQAAMVEDQAETVAELWCKAQNEFIGLLEAVHVLRRQTEFRKNAEKGLKTGYARRRLAGQRLSAVQLAAERTFGSAATYVINFEAGMAGLFELERAFDVTSLIQDRLEGSCLFMYE
jgi:hypothetical protein